VTQSSDPWLNLPACDYQADGFSVIVLPISGVDESGALRVARRARPWQPGVKLDHTGPDSDKLTLKLLWSNDVEDEGQGPGFWPDKLEELIAQFKSGKTATLNLPWKRGLRVKPLTWSRSASAEGDRGGELVTLNFETDNEDNLDREAFQKVSVKATVQSSVEAAQFDMESIGAWDGSIEDVTQLAADLVGYLNAPGDYAQALLHQANRLRRAAQFLTDSFSTTVEGRDQFNGPEGSSARLKLLELMELAAFAASEARAAMPKTRTITTQRDTDIWIIAGEQRPPQDARALMSINGQIEDFAAIPKGTAVLVFAE
jgi:hypothetical protein